MFYFTCDRSLTECMKLARTSRVWCMRAFCVSSSRRLSAHCGEPITEGGGEGPRDCDDLWSHRQPRTCHHVAQGLGSRWYDWSAPDDPAQRYVVRHSSLYVRITACSLNGRRCNPPTVTFIIACCVLYFPEMLAVCVNSKLNVKLWSISWVYMYSHLDHKPLGDRQLPDTFRSTVRQLQKCVVWTGQSSYYKLC